MSATSPVSAGSTIAFSRSRPCLACGGNPETARGKGERCHGFISSDFRFFRCSREEFAGSIEADQTGLFVHLTVGDCLCGTTHDGRTFVEQPLATTTKRRTIHPTRERLRRAAEYSAGGMRIVAEYEYRDLNDIVCLIVFRLEDGVDKTFRQGVSEGAGFVLSGKGKTLVPFHLKELRAAIEVGDTVYVCEGEKDVLAVEQAGFPATCNAMGAGRDVVQYGEFFEGANVVRIVADRDKSGVGLNHAMAWAAVLEPIVDTVEIIHATKGKDAHDSLVVHNLPIAEAFVPVEVEFLAKYSGAAFGDAPERMSGDPARYPVISLALITPNLENDYIVKGVIARESIVVVYGQSGSSKSFTAQEIGLAIAAGKPWRGRRTRRGRVVYVAAEGARGMRNRLVAAKQHMALGPIEAVDFLLVPSVVRLIEDTPDIDRFVRSVREATGGSADLVIIDTLSQSMPGKDENGPKDMTAAVAAAQQIRDELGATVMIVHHSGKNAALGARGHTSLRAAADTELEVKQGANGVCRVKATKQKEGENGEEWHHRLEQVEIGVDEDGDPVTTAVVRALDDREAAEAVAVQTAFGEKSNRLVEDVVAVCVELLRAGRGQRLSQEVIAASEYAKELAKQGQAQNLRVVGLRRFDVISLLQERFGVTRNVDDSTTHVESYDKRERKKEKDRRFAAASRRIRKGIMAGVIVTHGDWLWLRERAYDS